MLGLSLFPFFQPQRNGPRPFKVHCSARHGAASSPPAQQQPPLGSPEPSSSAVLQAFRVGKKGDIEVAAILRVSPGIPSDLSPSIRISRFSSPCVNDLMEAFSNQYCRRKKNRFRDDLEGYEPRSAEQRFMADSETSADTASTGARARPATPEALPDPE